MNENERRLYDLLALIRHQIHWAKKLGWFDDGSDTYGATFWRCWFGYFFMMHLPNQWSGDSMLGEGDSAFNLTGPLFAAFIIGSILGAGYYFMRCEESRWLKRQLTDEFLIAHYAAKKRFTEANPTTRDKGIEEADALIARHLELDASTDLGAWIRWLQTGDWRGDEKIRIDRLEKFGSDHSAKIGEHFNATANPSDSEAPTSVPSKLRATWEKTFEFCMYYAYAQWIIWMLTTLILYQTWKGYGINDEHPEHSDQPGFFNDASQHMLIFQVTFPLLIALAASLYNTYSQHHIQKPLVDKSAPVQTTLSKVRGYYLVNKDPEDSASGSTDTVSHQHFLKADLATAATTFIGYFLIANVLAWPAIGFFGDLCELEMSPRNYVPTIFAATGAAALIQAGLKYHDMRCEEKDVFNGEKTITVSRGLSFTQLYRQKEHWHQACYYVVGRLVGNGGILMTRMLFNGEGMGNYRVHDGEASLESMDRMQLLMIALAVSFLIMIPLNLYQHWKAVEREGALNEVRDRKLKTQAG